MSPGQYNWFKSIVWFDMPFFRLLLNSFAPQISMIAYGLVLVGLIGWLTGSHTNHNVKWLCLCDCCYCCCHTIFTMRVLHHTFYLVHRSTHTHTLQTRRLYQIKQIILLALLPLLFRGQTDKANHNSPFSVIYVREYLCEKECVSIIHKMI